MAAWYDGPSGTWVVYLKDPTDPEDDVFIGERPTYQEASILASDHEFQHENERNDYSIEWEDFRGFGDAEDAV